MANLNFSSDYMDSLGPLGAMWLGEQFRTSQNTANINQDNTLESIAKSQQDRDIAKQKLPFELSELQHKQAMQPGALEKQGLENKEKLVKLDKDKFDNFFGDFRNTIPQLQGTPADGALLADVARKHGMDPADPRIRRMIDTAASGNAKAVNDMLQKIALAQEKSIQERARQGDVDTAHMARTNVEQAGQDRRNAATNAASLERARIQAQAKANASSKMQSLLQITKGDPVKTKAALIQMGNEALQAGKNEEAEAFFQQANDPSLTALAANQQAQRAQPTITPEGGIGMTGGPQPVPPAGPGGQAPGPQPVAPPQPAQQRPVGAKGTTKDGRPVTWDGQGWKLDAPGK